MRESIGGALMLRIFLVVIVIFVVFLCVTVNFARAFRVKNGVINIIEQYEGINTLSIEEVRSYIGKMGYSCKPIDFEGTVTDYVLNISNTDSNGDDEVIREYDGKKDKIYNVQVCVDWNFPVIDAFGTWRFVGKTEVIKDVVE